MTIRRAQPSDADRVWPLVVDFAGSSPPGRAAFERSWSALGTDAASLVLVATTVELGVVGYLLAHARTSFLADGAVVWVEEIMVDQRARRCGVGGALMAGAECWAGGAGAGYVALASRRAGPFYVALGYEDAAVFYKKTLDVPSAPGAPPPG